MDREISHEKRNLMRNTFRRNSSTDHGREVIDRKRMLTIFGRMGQPIDEIELNKFMDRIDTEHTGMLDYDGFSRVCNKFVKDAAALAKFKGDEFAFKHLINLNDFQNE